MIGLARIKGNVAWASLWSGPEGGAFLIFVVWWEDREQILDRVVEIRVESVLGEEHTVLEGVFLLHFDEVFHFLEVGDHTGRSGVVFEGEKVSLWIIKIGNKIARDVNEEFVELVSAPFDAVLNLIWEVSKSAHWDGFFWWILRVTVALSNVRNNHLRVSLGTKSSGLKERLLVPNAFSVDVESSLEVIDSINNEVLAFPELIVEYLFGVWANNGHVILDIQVRVHAFSNFTGTLRFGVANVILSEQELSVEVGDLNVVIIGDRDFTLS